MTEQVDDARALVVRCAERHGFGKEHGIGIWVWICAPKDTTVDSNIKALIVRFTGESGGGENEQFGSATGMRREFDLQDQLDSDVSQSACSPELKDASEALQFNLDQTQRQQKLGL